MNATHRTNAGESPNPARGARRRCRAVISTTGAFAVFLALAWIVRPCWPIVLREEFILMEQLGLITRAPGSSLWGQIAGRNIPHHEEWMRWVMQFFASLIVFGPVMIAAWLAWARWGLRIPFSTCIGRRAGFAWLLFAAALGACAMTVFGVVLEERVRWWMFDLGKWAGCSYFQSGAVLMGQNGPFLGGPKDDLFNWLFRNLPWILQTLTGFGLGTAALWTGWLRRLPTQSDHLCPSCSYDLAGLPSSTVCPECGTPHTSPE